MTSTGMSEFLQNKIGYHDNKDGKNYGMCMSVLNKCQDITYTGSGQNAEYNPVNNVVKEFLNRTLVQIKSSQDTILADYAEDCIMDVASCLAQNNYDADALTQTGNNIAVRACLPVIYTCMSVNGVQGNLDNDTTVSAQNWIKEIMGTNIRQCPSGTTGAYPDCICTDANAVYIISKNQCIKCPESGKYPNCTCTTPNAVYVAATNQCIKCPESGTYPDCTCTNGAYDIASNTCTSNASDETGGE